MQENKISPFKYSAGLVKGAGDVAKADVAGDLIKPKAAMEMGKSVARTGIALTKYFGEIGKQYDAFVENVTNNGAQLSDENFEALYDELQSGRSSFILGSKKDRTLKIKDLTELAASYDDYKNLVENVAVMADSKDGLLSMFKNSPEGSAYLDAISGRQRLIKNPNKGVKINLKPGDMLIYSGCDLEHWREPFTGTECGQVFLHYNQEGTNANLFDGRIHIGYPEK